MMYIRLEKPSTQIEFARALSSIRQTHLQDALLSSVSLLDIKNIDTELHLFADDTSLQVLARHGIRGELLFAVPCLLLNNPHLLGYYRLLLGYSQKSFYTSSSGIGMFKSMEERGTISPRQCTSLPSLCYALNENASVLLESLIEDQISRSFFDQLTLLTLGPQLRGGVNVKRGSSATLQVFQILLSIIGPAVIRSDSHNIELKNKADRRVLIQFAADPDIVIREEINNGLFRNLVAIEVKGGQDYSNIHNRIGEAEKSHQKAKKSGYIECWTIVNVDSFDLSMAKRESPTTNHFFRISQISNPNTEEGITFSSEIRSIISI